MKTRSFFLVVLIYFCMYGCGKKEPDVIKIGAILPLSGDAAAYGSRLKSGIDLAVDHLNGAGGVKGRKIMVEYEDSKADPKTAVSAYEKLSSVNEISFFLGPFTSSEVLAVAPIAERNKLIILSPGASSPAITQAGDYTFRIVTSDNFDGQVMAKYARQELRYSRVAILHVNNDYGVGVKNSFERNFLDLGGQVTTVEAYDPNSREFRTQLGKIKASNPNAIFLVGLKEMGMVLKQAGDIGLRKKFLSIGLFEDPSILQIAGLMAEGVIYSLTSFQVDDSREAVRSFVEKYRSRYSKDPDILSALGFDALNVLASAIGNAETTSPAEVKTMLYGIQRFSGATGEMSFDRNGDVQKPFGIKKVENGKFVWITEHFE